MDTKPTPTIRVICAFLIFIPAVIGFILQIVVTVAIFYVSLPFIISVYYYMYRTDNTYITPTISLEFYLEILVIGLENYAKQQLLHYYDANYLL